MAATRRDIAQAIIEAITEFEKTDRPFPPFRDQVKMVDREAGGLG